MPPAERLQKILSAAGVASRRASEELIAAGRVTVDGRRAELGDRADPVTAVIHVDGERVVTDASRVYLAMNKPRGVVSTMDDERGRAALADYLPASAQRVYHVGRLDADSEGLLLLTNDGDLANKLMHPSYEVKKTYLCQITGPVPRGLGRQLRSGVELDDGPARADSFRVVDSAGRNVLVEIVLHEGRNQQIRRMFDAIGHSVLKLARVRIGELDDLRLPVGKWRKLQQREVDQFKRRVASKRTRKPARKGA